MRKIILVSLVFILLLSNVAYAESSNKLYNQAIESIDEWLNSIPEDYYEKANTDQVFQWKIDIENIENNYERYILYNEILKNISDEEFNYERNIYNSKTINYYIISYYFNYFKECKIKNKSLSKTPSEFLTDKYHYYQNHITNKKEQFIWIEKFTNSFTFSMHRNKDIKKDYIEILAKEKYDKVIEILKIYMVLIKYFSNDNQILLTADECYSTYNSFAMGDGLNIALGNIYEFVQSWEEYLKAEDKKMILNFVYPEFKEKDNTVKIYSYLNNKLGE